MNLKSKDPNTPKLWDNLLFEKNDELIQSSFYNDKIHKVLKYLKRHKGSILDIGFGRANLERKLLSQKLKYSIYGVDISPKTVASVNKEVRGKFVVGNIFELPFQALFFDAVLALDVLEHIARDKVTKGYKEINRVLKKNGNFIISVPINEGLKRLNKESQNYNAHLREYTLKVLMRELERAGFKIIKYEYLYAFRKFYKAKSYIIKLAPFLRVPNLLIVYSKKK